MATKVCSICKLEKEISKFAIKRTSRDGKMSACKSCRNTKYRQLRHCNTCGESVPFNKNLKYCIPCKSKYDKTRKEEKRKEYKEFLRGLGCSCCKYNHPDALEVHHINKNTKRFNSRAQNSAYNVEDINLGLAIVLCANCHLLFHNYFGGRQADFPFQTKESTVEIINNSRRITP